MTDNDQTDDVVNPAKSDMESAIVYAQKFLEDVLSFLGLNTVVYATHEDDVIQLNIPSTQMNGFLIGQHGDTMRSMQLLASSALKSQGYAFTRVNVDVAGYKQQRASRLADTAEAWVKQVKETGESMELRPMNAADRRVIHQLASDRGLTTESVGDGRNRHVILKPLGEATAEHD